VKERPEINGDRCWGGGEGVVWDECICREAMYGGFWKNIISVHPQRDLPLGQSDMFFQQLNAHRYSLVTAGTMPADCFFGEEGYGLISGGTRVLELAADI
jgi:hypothetical protein